MMKQFIEIVIFYSLMVLFTSVIFIGMKSKDPLPVHNQNYESNSGNRSDNSGGAAKGLPYFVYGACPSGACGTWCK